MLPLVVLIGIGPMVSWGSSNAGKLFKKLRLLIVVSVILGIALPLVAMGRTTLMVSAAVTIAMWSILSTLQYLRERLQRNTGKKGLSAGVYGMVSAHLGIGVFVIGVTLSSAFSVERDIHMLAGDQVEMNGYVFKFEGTAPSTGPNYRADTGKVTVSLDGKQVAILHPEKRTYFVQTMPMTEAAIDAGLFRDLYVALAEKREGGGWALRVYHKPFQRWIWLGTLMMAFGGLLAALDRRYRSAARRIVRARNKLTDDESVKGARA